MSSLVLMRWLEGSPERYDAGMRALTFGRITDLHAAVADAAVVERDDRVLEIGCGTGSVTGLLLERGAQVMAIDQSPEMLEIAAARVGITDADRVEWLEQTAAEIDKLPRDHFDAVAICLCLSDMSAGERAFVLREAVLFLAAASSSPMKSDRETGGDVSFNLSGACPRRHSAGCSSARSHDRFPI